MKELLLIFVGGGIGSVLRYLVSRFVASLTHISFPLGTLSANVLACLLLGVLMAYTETKIDCNPMWRLLIGIGICGGFSTFSTYSFELLTMLKANHFLAAGTYAMVSMALCVAALVAGIFIFKTLLS